MVGTSKETTFRVTNIGGGTLTGQASIASPFSVVGDAQYSLSPGQSATIAVRFSPIAEVDYQASLSFSGGGGASRAVFGTGVTSKRVIIVGCASVEGGGASIGGDVAVILGALLLASVLWRRHAARRA